MKRYDDLSWVPSEELLRLSQGETPWNYYLETQVYIEADGFAGTVRPVPEQGDSESPSQQLHVISATQPGADPTSEESAERLAILDAELQQRPIAPLMAIGSSFDGEHQEESRAVFGLDDQKARQLGLKYGQVAIFSWRGEAWSLLACASPRRADRSWKWVNAEPS